MGNTNPRYRVTREFSAGFRAPFRAMKFCAAHPATWKHLIVPALINTVVLVASIWAVIQWSDDALATVWTRPEVWYLVGLWWLTYVLVLLTGLVTSYVVLITVGAVIAAPFTELLAERVEVAAGFDVDVPFRLRDFAAESWLAIRHTLGYVGLYLLLMVPVLALNVIPGLGSILATVASFGVASHVLALEAMDSSMSRRRFLFKEKLMMLRLERARLVGLGAAAWLLTLVPVVNLVMMPFAVMGGSLVFIDLAREGRIPWEDRRLKRLPGEPPQA